MIDISSSSEESVERIQPIEVIDISSSDCGKSSSRDLVIEVVDISSEGLPELNQANIVPVNEIDCQSAE